jgi:hypothetical protein
MYTPEIIIFGIVGVLGILFVILAVLNVRNERKHDMNYQKYVESVQVGDTFGHNSFKFSGADDPFNENHNKLGLDPYYYVTILDIKKNYKGEIWVKYCFTRVLNNHHCEWTDEINDFLRYRTRISKRIDNINTLED